MSWIQNEISMGAQARAYRDFEFDCPLPLRKEAKEPRVLYYEWQKLLVRDDVRKLVLPTREEIYQAYEHLVQIDSAAIIDGLTQCQNNLPEESKQGEPHSLQNFQAAMERAPKYIQLGREKTNKWLPLIFQPPILMWPLLGCKTMDQPYEAVTKESTRWSRMKKMKGFYWNLALGGTGKGSIGDLRISAIIRNFPFAVGSTSS